MKDSLIIRSPDGRDLNCPVAPEPGQSIADWLETNGHFLNTRCGKRGLCRGCRIEMENGESVAACQCGAETLAGQTLQVPASSLRDATLTGVTAFELDETLNGPFALPDGAGLALDIGTTTLAAALWIGDPPQCLALATRPNPQIRYGDNVVSRVHTSLENREGLADLHRTLCQDGLIPLIQALLQDAGLDPAAVAAVTVSGNPVMLHTLAQESLSGFASFPFRPAFLEARKISGAVVGLSCDLQLLPSPGAFVGSDVLGGAVASGMYGKSGARLLIDFGTNGEILLRDAQGKGWCTATAAGPAFEGGRLGCGAAAGPGVIGRLEMDERGEWHLPEGTKTWRAMAGAAYVDFLALGVRAGWLSPFGRFSGEGSSVARIADTVSVSESDIAELLQAKAAIQAGWITLLECAGTAVEDLEEVVVAGGFGYHLTPAHAVEVGLLPPVAPERIRLVGNASLAGASLALLGQDGTGGWTQWDGTMSVIELNQIESFEDHYISSLSLDPDS